VTIRPVAYRRSYGLQPLIKLAVATAAVSLCLAWLWVEWDRRVGKGFPAGQKPVPVPVLTPPPTGEPKLAGAAEHCSPPSADAIDVYVSPDGGATEAIMRELGLAQHRVLVQAYSFTSAAIAKALVDAKRRGVEVTVVLDDSQRSDKYTTATFLHNEGVPVAVGRHGHL